VESFGDRVASASYVVKTWFLLAFVIVLSRSYAAAGARYCQFFESEIHALRCSEIQNCWCGLQMGFFCYSN